MNPQGSIAESKKRPKSRAPLRWGGVVANDMACRHHGCSGVVTFVTFETYQILSSFYTQIMPWLAYYSEAAQASREASPSKVSDRETYISSFICFCKVRFWGLKIMF